MTHAQTLKHTANLKHCERHGVLYNEKRYNSCAVCRASADSPALTAGSLALGVLGVALIFVGVALGGGPTVMALAEAGDRAVAETAQSIRLDPSPIRAEIVSLENLIYGPESGVDEMGPRIRAAAAMLAESITRLDGAPAPLLERFGREIAAFGVRSDPRQTGEASSRGLTTSIDWEAVRSRVFAEASWYRHSNAGVESLTEQ